MEVLTIDQLVHLAFGNFQIIRRSSYSDIVFEGNTYDIIFKYSSMDDYHYFDNYIIMYDDLFKVESIIDSKIKESNRIDFKNILDNFKLENRNEKLNKI